MIPRRALLELQRRLSAFAAVALLGPRQIGKTTLARQLAEQWPGGAVYLDLERPADVRRLTDPDLFLRSQAPRLVILDKVHRMPALFQVLRGVVDDNRANGFRAGQFLLLGSASLDLIREADESLAGRLSHLELAGISVDEAASAGLSLDQAWLRGGYPDSLTAATDEQSALWRADLIRSYLERDVPMFAPRIPTETLRRLWTMIAHTSGGLLNASRLATNLGISGPTVDRYVDLLTDLGLVRRLEPWFANLGKRLVKSPKVYVRDTGLLHCLLEIDTAHVLRGHPVVGASFESLCVESLIDAAATGPRPYFFRTATGDEIDLLFTRADEPAIAVEVKLSTAPTLTPGFHRACDALGVEQRWLVTPGDGGAPYRAGPVEVVGLASALERLRG